MTYWEPPQTNGMVRALRVNAGGDPDEVKVVGTLEGDLIGQLHKPDDMSRNDTLVRLKLVRRGATIVWMYDLYASNEW